MAPASVDGAFDGLKDSAILADLEAGDAPDEADDDGDDVDDVNSGGSNNNDGDGIVNS